MSLVRPLVRSLVRPLVRSVFPNQNPLKFSLFTPKADHTLSTEPVVGSATPTYTRATTATVEDWEGTIHTVPAGELRWMGARRTENLLTYSNDFSNAAWAKSNFTLAEELTIFPTALDSAWKLTPDSTTSIHTLRKNNAVVEGDLRFSVYAKYNGCSYIII